MICGNIYPCIYLINCKVHLFVCVGGPGLLRGYVLSPGSADWLKHDTPLVVSDSRLFGKKDERLGETLITCNCELRFNAAIKEPIRTDLNK